MKTVRELEAIIMDFHNGQPLARQLAWDCRALKYQLARLRNKVRLMKRQCTVPMPEHEWESHEEEAGGA